MAETKIFKDAFKKSQSSKLRYCFYNSQLLAMGDSTKNIEYWEGFTFMEHYRFPVLHGFNIINGKVIDVTHKIKRKPILGDFGVNKEYMGVKLKTDMIYDQMLAQKPCVTFIGNYYEGWPLLKNRWNK